jgi:hypothetical protein
MDQDLPLSGRDTAVTAADRAAEGEKGRLHQRGTSCIHAASQGFELVKREVKRNGQWTAREVGNTWIRWLAILEG